MTITKPTDLTTALENGFVVLIENYYIETYISNEDSITFNSYTLNGMENFTIGKDSVITQTNDRFIVKDAQVGGGVYEVEIKVFKNILK